MAQRIEAINFFRPKVKRARTNDMKVVVSRIAGRTGLNKGEIQNILSEFNETIIEYSRQGIHTKIDDLGTFWPSIDLNGKFKINLRKDTSFGFALNTPGVFVGEILNSENIGKSSDELVDMWNAEFPDDPVEDEE